MSDIATDLPAPPGEPTPDTEFLALLDKLGPVLAELGAQTIEAAKAAVPTPTFRPGEVQGIDPAARTASVLLDGDTAPITAQVLTDMPGRYDRVMVTFVPPSSVFVTGLITTSGVPAGTIAPYAGPITHHPGAESSATSGAPPRGWLWCAGQAVSRADYPALFAAIGTTYGSGNGTTTFNVPDFRGRTLVGLDNMGGTDAGRLSSANALGTTGGAETHTLATTNLPSHDHSLGSHSHSWSGSVSGSVTGGGTHSHTTNATRNDGTAAATAGGDVFVSLGGASVSGDGSHSHGFSGSVSGSVGNASGNTGTAGSGTAVNHMPPFASVHLIIKA